VGFIKAEHPAFCHGSAFSNQQSKAFFSEGRRAHALHITMESMLERYPALQRFWNQMDSKSIVASIGELSLNVVRFPTFLAFSICGNWNHCVKDLLGLVETIYGSHDR